MLDMISNSIIGETITTSAFLICTISSLVGGLCIAAVHSVKNRYSKSFLVTLVLLPAMVQLVIMLVNGNMGTGIAVMGAFSLVRFRSIPGSAKEISSLFFAMAIGLATGMGYIYFGLIFLIVIGVVNILLSVTQFGMRDLKSKKLRITVPEDLEYEGLFDDIFEKYTDGTELERIKTTNVGSLFELSYDIRLKASGVPKEFIDELRARNGNLTVIINSVETEGL